jgi:hypothetical protein
MPWVGFEPTIPVFERAKTFHALDRVATEIGFVLVSRAFLVTASSSPLFTRAFWGLLYKECCLMEVMSVLCFFSLLWQPGSAVHSFSYIPDVRWLPNYCEMHCQRNAVHPRLCSQTDTRLALKLCQYWRLIQTLYTQCIRHNFVSNIGMQTYEFSQRIGLGIRRSEKCW